MPVKRKMELFECVILVQEEISIILRPMDYLIKLYIMLQIPIMKKDASGKMVIWIQLGYMDQVTAMLE